MSFSFHVIADNLHRPVLAGLRKGDELFAAPFLDHKTEDEPGRMTAMIRSIKQIPRHDGLPGEIWNAVCEVESITRRLYSSLDLTLRNMDMIVTEFPDGKYRFQMKRLKAIVEVYDDRAIIKTKIVPQAGFPSFIRDITYFCQALGLTTGREHEVIPLN